MDNRFIPEGTGRRRGANARSAVLDPIVGYSRSQSGAWARPFSASDRALVILIENGGVDLGIPALAGKIYDLLPGTSLLPAGLKDQIESFLETKIKSLTDSLLETAELTLNRYNAAKPSIFGDVIVLRDGTATYGDLKSQLIGLTKAGKVIDVLILTHGGTNRISLQSAITGDMIRAIKTENGGPLAIRVVYMMNCVGSSLNQAWIDAGARASSGSIRNNYLPEPTMYFFWQNWKAGQGFETAVTSAYRKTINLMNDAVRTFISDLPIPGSSTVAGQIGFDNLEFVKDSAPVVQGSRAITINSDDLTTAQSLSSSLATTVLPVRLLQSMSTDPRGGAPARSLSPAGLDFIKSFETFRGKLHNDAYGNCTIGFGSQLHAGVCDTRPVEQPYADGISQDQATELLRRQLGDVQQHINDCVTGALNQNQYDALVSVVSDIGGDAFEQSSMLRLINAGNLSAVPSEIRKWTRVRVNGVVVERPELQQRRNAEADRFARVDARGASTMSFAGSFSGVDYTIPGTFEIIPQPSPMTCWAAVFTMMYCWRNTKSIAIRDALATVDQKYVDIFDRNGGIDATTAQALYTASGLVPLNSFSPTIDGWVTLLKKYGPLYVDIGNITSNNTHAIIVTGMSGDGTPSGTSITYVNPAGGKTVTAKFDDFLARFEASSAVTWPYTIVHWPPATGADASLSIVQSSTYYNPAADLARAQVAPIIVAGMELGDALQVGLAGASMVQSGVQAGEGAFGLTFDKADRLLTSEARAAMPGAASGGKTQYRRLVFHMPQMRAGTAHADVYAEWAGNAYGEIETVIFSRDLDTSTEFSHSSANVTLDWVKSIPPGGDPRGWPLNFNYHGMFDPLGNGYYEFSGKLAIDAFGGIVFYHHKVVSRSAAEFLISGDVGYNVQCGPAVYPNLPDLPADQLAYLKAHLP